MSISATTNGMRPVHPGEILREDYLKPLGLSSNALAQALKVPASRINDIVLERRDITVDTALRLVRYFGGDARSWMNLQTAYEIKVAGEEDRGGSTAAGGLIQKCKPRPVREGKFLIEMTIWEATNDP
jgi:antitoxin HigA-1